MRHKRRGQRFGTSGLDVYGTCWGCLPNVSTCLGEREEMGVRRDPGAEAAAPVGASLLVGHAPTATDVFELLVGQLIALFPDQGQDILGRLARVRLGLLLFG